ncbi:MAG: type II toxin-antitoxin system VapC family toxin [Myxococcaceae bacterium]
MNLLVYAYDSDAVLHVPARAWWEETLSEAEPVGLPWVVVMGFVRLMTHRRVLVRPVSVQVALADVRTWFGCTHVQVLEPGPRHFDLFESLLQSVGAAGNLTTDAHLAALAIEHRCELHSNDVDFGRFSGLRWKNPLES